jgi:oxygen-dependent protoporphyrinogen oxidase
MRVAVVGAGIGGLVAALDLREAGCDVVVLEGADQVGGKLRVDDVGDLRVDVGAESMLARRPEAVDLAARVGAELTHPATTSAAIWTRGALRPLPPTVMGVPADLDALEASGILAERPVPHAEPVPDDDVSVAAFLAPRVGREVVDRLVEPLLGGVYAGHADRLSLRAAAPQVLALGADPLAGAAATRATTRTLATPVFAGVVGGVGTLPQRVVEHGDLDVRLRSTVRAVRVDGGVWTVSAGPVSAIETYEVDAVVVATPAPATARLLAEVAPPAAFALAAVDYASMALVTFVLDGPIDVEGSGFLVPPVDGTVVKGSTISSQKWAWLGERAGDRTVVRASIGRAGDTAVLHRDDADVAALALADLTSAYGGLPPVLASHVQRWGGGLPQYDVGHLGRVATVEAAVALVDGLEVCGAAYHGVGIPAVVASARAAAARLHAR